MCIGCHPANYGCVSNVNEWVCIIVYRGVDAGDADEGLMVVHLGCWFVEVVVISVVAAQLNA